MTRTVNLSHTRTTFQREVMERIVRDKVCPFCEKYFLRYHTKPIIKKGTHWIITENFQPYEGSKHHLLAVSRKHVADFSKLSAVAHAELFALFAAEAKKRKIPGGTILMRYGDTDYTGGSVEHLHAHLISGSKRASNRNVIQIGIGYGTRHKSTGPSRG